MATYITESGDTWDRIAFIQMGSEYHMPGLMMRNRRYINYSMFPSGIALEIPEVTQPINQALPPWKRKAAGT